ncbi:centromere protein F [Leptodactylus fuscus]|uniref:centromere protein F n=1 Tax=Leptodactylus fuscus TaxID=238119 RepID=UPI003F4EFD65
MSWVVEEWKEGLPTKTLQKIQELESQLDKLKKERQQKQFQLESLEAAFQKQKQKVESEKSEVTALKRENQSLIELCDNQEKTRQKLSHEQQVKDTQINFLEGQLSASKKHIEKLEQELKRYKNDLERSQQSDMSVCVTPQKSFTAAITPVKFNGNICTESKYEDLQEKYNKEVEERKRLETELKILQIKLVNQTPQPTPQNTMNHRDIARHQTSSSVFSWQQERTPSRTTSSSHDASLKRNYSSIHYPWEQEETPSKRGLKSDSVNRSFSESSNNPANDQLRNQNQELRSKVGDLELRVQVQEKELKNQLNKLQETQKLLEKTQAELAERDKTLVKSRDDLARVTVQYEQSIDKCTSAEQKLKKVSEELSCQRQNAESARLTLEQKLKEQEKEHQQELSRQQTALKNMEQQLNQTRTKLSQESQQAKNEFNAIQSELDRVTHGKKILEHEAEDLKQKLSRAEQTASNIQNQVSDLKKELEDARSQQNALKSQLDQKTREHAKLDEEFRTANQTLRQNQVFIDELKNKNNTLEVEMKAAVQKLNYQDTSCLENLKATMTNLEKEKDFAKEMLQKRENDLTEMKNAQAKLSEELTTLKNHLHCKEQECTDLAQWKNEYENNTIKFFTEKDEMSRRIKDLDTKVQSLTDQITLLENDKKNLHTQIKTLQDIIDVRSSDLEVQKVNCANLSSQMVSESQKYQKEIENLLQKISELETQRKTQEVWSNQVSFLENELETQKKINSELQSQHDLLLRSQREIQKQASEVEEKHESRSSEPNVDCLASIIKEKEEEIHTLSEKLNLAKAEMESVSQKNKELINRLQELNLLSESWSAERETLAKAINSYQKDIEKLTEEKKRLGEACNVLKNEKTQLKTAKIDTSESDSIAEDSLVDRSREENASQDENLKGEVAEWKGKVSRIQQENSRLLRANEELSSLVGKLRENECSLHKSLEDLRVCLKDKETSLRNIETKLELLNKSGKEEDPPVERVQEQLIDLQSPPNNGNGSQSTKVSQDGPESQKEKKTIFHSLDDTALIGTDGIFMDNSLLDITGDISLFNQSVGPQNREENLTLLINMDHLSLASANDTTLMLPDLTQRESKKPAIKNLPVLSPFTSPPAKERVDRNESRKSITSEIVDLLLQQSPPQQQQALSLDVKSNESDEMKDFMVYQMELSRLQQQHLSEIATWQEKLKEQVLEMETKLSAEKAVTERLTQELEAARLELQVFDLSARSLLSFDNDDLTGKLDTANQTICTVLPIGSLSLANQGHLKQSPKVKSEAVDENITKMVNHESPKEKIENNENSSRERKRRKSPRGAHVDKLEDQDAPENLQLKTEEKQNLCKTKDREDNQSLVMEIKDLSAQIEVLKEELLNRDQEIQDLDNKSKELEIERLELLGQIELISSEKSESANKIAEFEKELQNSSNAMEILKQQLSELSNIRESLELSSKEWKENYLQTELELKRAKSDKANIENHALSLEADLDALQSKCQRLQEESEGHLRSFNEIRENLNTVVAEKCQLNRELESLVEEKEELDQMYHKLKVKEQELESSKVSSKELIKILEAELRTLKEELQAAKLTAEQLKEERDSMVGLKENEMTQVQELKNEVLRIQEEKKILVTGQEDLQIQLSTMQAENEKLSRTLERCQHEKKELGQSLNSAQEEVTLMRTGIEKLKVKIEADEKKKQRSMEKLKESERKFDKLNDKIESLERELVMSEENLENAILQEETAKEEVERVKEQKEALEIELNCLRKKIEELEEELERSREKIVELEATIGTIMKTLENKDLECTQYRDDFKKQQDLLQVELEDLLAQKALSDQKHETTMAEYADISSKMKQQNEQLQQELEQAQMSSSDLKMSLEKLTLEQEECKLQLDEKTQQLVALENQIKDAEQSETKYSSEVSRLEVECENLRNTNKSLQTAVEELEEKVQTLSEENETLLSTMAGLKTSCSDLEAQMESTKTEKQNLLDKVAELGDNCQGLQKKLQDADLHIKGIEEQKCRERRDLEEEMEAIKRQHKDSSAQLLTATSEAEEMKASLTSLQSELESQVKKHKDDIKEYEERLLQAESRHQSLLDEIREQQASELARYREKLTSLETHLNVHKQEIDCLKAGNGELNESLRKAREQLAELKRLKENFEDLKKENAKTSSDLRQWMKSCEALQGEKEQLQKRLSQQEETLKDLTEKHHTTDTTTSDNDLLSEIEELKQCLEEKTEEADESVEKYCNLMIKTHKLEDTNETLKKQLEVLSTRLKELKTKKEATEPQTSQPEVEAEEAKKRRKSRRSTQGKQAGKRRRESGNMGQTPSTPQALTKRVKKTASRSLEEEYEPEGLPEIVKKGFSDIPSGKQSPHVLRRTAVPLRRSPRITSQTNSPSVLNKRIDNLENIPDLNSPTLEGSKSHVAKTAEDAAPMDVRSPLSTYIKKTRASDKSCAGEPEKARASVGSSHDDTVEDGACQVQ